MILHLQFHYNTVNINQLLYLKKSMFIYNFSEQKWVKSHDTNVEAKHEYQTVQHYFLEKNKLLRQKKTCRRKTFANKLEILCKLLMNLIYLFFMT